MAGQHTQHIVRLAGSHRRFAAAPDRSILDAAFAAQLDLPHACRSGNCGACRARLLEGRILYPRGQPLGLTADEVSAGYVLLCQAEASTDIRIDVAAIQRADLAVLKHLPCRISRVERWSPDVLGLFLRLPSAERLDFAPGQFVNVLLAGGRRRSYSIASPPHAARPLELHVRRVPGGLFSGPLFETDMTGRLLTIEGPLGNFVYREGAGPLLLMAGGTGLAPILSILRHVLENRIERRIYLYRGATIEREMYVDARLAALAAAHRNLTVVTTLTDPAAGWPGRRGPVHRAVLEDFQDLAHFDLYAAGPPAMIAALREDFAARGIDPARIAVDPFDYAAEDPSRQ